MDTSTLTGAFVVGFQGWFACPGDGHLGNNWVQWFGSDTSDPGHTRIDFLPDVSELTPAELCKTGLTDASGNPIYLFSDQNPQTVLRQFQWMQQYGIGTVALQRFITALAPATEGMVNQTLANVEAAAQQTGRGFYIEYDLGNSTSADWATTLVNDWQQLLASGVTNLPTYQHHNGKPVLAIYGIGVENEPGTAVETAALVASLRSVSAATGGVTLIASTPPGWRTNTNAKTDPGWLQTYESFDIISPWAVGSYSNPATYAAFVTKYLAPDIAATNAAHIGYMPVIYPGFSWHNLKAVAGASAPLDQIPRNCGQFLQMQVSGAISAGATMLFGAMFDEVNEGTALFKTVPNTAQLPASGTLPMVALGESGCAATSDFYLTLAGKVQQQLAASVQQQQQ